MMANDPNVNIEYTVGCGDCGNRRVKLPMPLPKMGDDFDWDVRDYDGYRLFMMEELSARFPERRNWTPADVEVVIVEVFSVVLDQLSDMNDRVQAEAFLETARRPDSVRRLLEMIGYKPLLHTDQNLLNMISDNVANDNQKLEKLWSYYPHLMEKAKVDGPRSIHQQHRMVTIEDYKNQLISHPLVFDVDAYTRWSGSWNTHYVVVRLINNIQLDEKLTKIKIASDAEDINKVFDDFVLNLVAYYQQQEIDSTTNIENMTARYLLQNVIEQQRMIGQEVLLQNATLVGINLSLSIQIKGDYFISEIKDMVEDVLLEGTKGFFASGNLSFGEDVVASNIIEVLSEKDGVGSVCINRLKRVGSVYPDQSSSGRIVLNGYEVAVLENDTRIPERGLLTIKLHGGKPG